MNRRCPTCGNYVPDDARFCPSCGAEQTTPPRFDGYHTQFGQPVYDANNPFDSSGPEGKSRGVAALLAIFLGGLGIHYFYLNKVTAGILTIVLSLFTCTLWTLLTFAQGIYFFCISNAEFERKFVNTSSTFPIF